jgi:hypothetical protein
MSMSPAPPRRMKGDFMLRSSLRATPLAMRKVAESSEKSVFSVCFACCTASLRVVKTALVSRKVLARLMPLMAPSLRFRLAAPPRPFFIAATVVPVGGDVQRHVAAPLQHVLVERILHERVDVDVGEVLLQRHLVVVGVDRERAGRLPS